MRTALGVVVAAALVCVASGVLRGPFADLFNTWNPALDAQYVKDFDHLSRRFHPEVHEEEHTRRKRNAIETAKYAAGNPITKACDRPGYTGQYCEFPICAEYNPFPNPEQYLTDDGYIMDISDLGNCSRSHEIVSDETMEDIKIMVQSLDNVSPVLTIYDSNGYIGTPYKTVKESDRFIAYFAYLIPGYYTVKSSAASLNSRCLLTVTAQTLMTISGGFQTDERDRNDFPNKDAAAHQFNSIMLHLNGGRSPAEIKTISVIGPDNYMFRPRLVDKRYGCQFEYYFDSIFCYEKGAYAMTVEGVTFFGYPFRRTAPFQCVSQTGGSTSAPATTSPVPTNPTGCDNGGVLLTSGGTTTCICQDHFTGYDCSQPLCINGGTLIQNKCFCSSGFEGVHCEQVKCEPNSNHGFGVDKPTLVFVVRVRQEMNAVMQQVQSAIDDVVANLQFDAPYLTRFSVVFFNNYTNFQAKHYGSIEQFDTDFYKATIATGTEGGCTDSVLGAVTTALTDLALTQASTVYVITDALADDYDTTMEALLQFNAYWRATINFVYVEPTAESQCISDLSDPGFRAFDDVANRFGGMAWHVGDRSKVYDALYGHMNSIIYKSQLMLTLDREECGNGLGKVIQLEKKTNNLVFIAKGRDFSLEVIAPDGQSLVTQMIVEQDSNNGIFSVQMTSDPIPGAYLIRTHTKAPTASCSVRAYQASYQTYTPDSPTEAFWAITTDVDVDAFLYQPLVGIDNHPVFHLENFGEVEDYDKAFAFLNMYAVRNGVEKEVYASNSLFRGGCTFQFYFPSFRCRPNENLHYEFNVRTQEGFYLQRGGVMTCFNSFPTPPTPGACHNGGVMMNETCLCMPHFEGAQCQTIICENGGTPLFDFCQCPNGFTGPFCVFPECAENGPSPNYGYHVDMAFLVEVTQQGIQQIQQLMASLPEIIRDVTSQHPDWIDRLVLIGYNSKEVFGMVDTPIENTKAFFDALNAWGNSNPTENGCNVQVWAAIDSLLNSRKDGNKQRVLPDRSVINIFESSLPQTVKLTISTSEELLERKTLTNVFQYKDAATNKWACDGVQDDFVYIEQAARRGDGKMFTIGNADIGKAVRMIPTLFSSSIVYKYHTEDCTVAQNIFFPVDAYTQTVSAVIAGNSASVQLFKYDGTPYKTDGRIEILSDDRNAVVEFRNPCDENWDSVSQYCMYFNPSQTRDFVAANTLCTHMNAFMADDLSDDKNNWLKRAANGQKVWLGLTYVGNTGEGTWYFQHDNGQALAVPANINYWTGGDIPNGATGSCAYFQNGVWYPANCFEKYLAVCQKHMFDSTNEPSALDDDDLSPGKYYLQVQTQLEGSWKGCDVEVRVQSDLNVEFGFVDGLRKDSPRPVANIDSDQNRIVSSLSIGKGETQTSILQHVQLRSDDASSLLLEAATFSYRLGCTYDFVSQPITCEETNGEDFSVVMIGEDDTGNTFQRYSTSLCYKWYICQNGGVYSNGQCLCPDYYTGDTCGTPICQNRGQLNKRGDGCICQDHYGGKACQFVHCKAPSGDTFSNDNKALILVIEKSDNTADAIQNLADNFPAIAKDCADRHPNWFKYFLLMSFTVDGKVDELTLYANSDDLTAHLGQLAKDSKGVAGACQGQIWTTIDHLFGKDLSKYLTGAEVMIISAAAPLDADLDSMHATMENFNTQTSIMDYVHVETPQCSVDDWATGLKDFANFLTTTGGTVFRVDPNNAGKAIQAFLPSRYAPQRISYSDPLNCQNNEMFVQIDTGMEEVYISLSGYGATIQVEDPYDGVHAVDQVWDSDYQKLWRLNPDGPGIYKVTANSNNRACFPMVYGNGGAQVIFGFIQDYNYGDTPKPYAVFGAVNFPVFYLLDVKTGGSSDTEFLYMAHMERQSIGGDYEVPYDSDIDSRDGCTYNYIGNQFTCLKENDVITLSASGVDASNQPFTRQSTSYCKKDATTPVTTPTAAPPKTTPTQTVPTTTALTPATLNFDLLFIIDETENDAFIKDTAEVFIEKIMSIYTPTQRFARVGLITMPQKPNKSMPVAFLSSIDSMEALDEDLTSLEDFNAPGGEEYLKQALSFANDPNKYRSEQHGYRNGINNHLIVILTAKNKFTDIDGAIAEAQKIATDQSTSLVPIVLLSPLIPACSSTRRPPSSRIRSGLLRSTAVATAKSMSR